MIQGWNEIILLLGAGQGFLLAVLLLSKKANRIANLFFSALIFLVSIKLLVPILYHSLHPVIIIINESSILLFAALHFLYAYMVIYPKKIKTPILYLLFLPFTLLIIFHIVYYYSTQILLINNKLYIHIFVIGSTIFSMVIMIFVLRIIKKYKVDIRNNLSSIEKISLDWLKLISLIIFIADALVLVIYPASYVFDFNVLSFISRIGVILAILIFITGYLVLNQPRIPNSEIKPEVKYKTSGLINSKSIEIEQKLKELLEIKKIYLKEKLTISEFTNEMNVPETYISQVINERFKLNFYNLIAKYRVEEAARRICSKEYNHLTLLAIAFDVGFGSKSTFNIAFKKFKGVTPSEFKRNKIVNS